MRATAWLIGDVHGCDAALAALLAHPELQADPDCPLWFTGDLVNRGVANAATLRRVRELGARATVVLGNHDLRALAIAAGALPLAAGDTLQDLLDAPDAAALIDWLRSRPLALRDGDYLLAHAGLYPGWDGEEAVARAAELEALLREPGWRAHMRRLSRRTAGHWRDHANGPDRHAFIACALTRMRLCGCAGELHFRAAATPGHWPAGSMPWFDAPRRADRRLTVLFGHWATLGLMVRPDAICVDTACVTGGALSALRLPDLKLVQVSSTAGGHPAHPG
ncbi:symmetrical bis(5'-nucleosyl)-tetraphosphatase [Bordetella genomosp. 1]|uniref:bis(5'-nucleosyl)-tetraphosphatase (symmetrical) n=1 Tax=Bordetella genomosp. 1 TaxID=1395607 RepID=A0ABX4F0X5_9BORD|nr:symmetrical bis(5'-nucleosyl)-tetraphosphatase [Bordetella genomosp. 1]OZI64004.1 bis(5'-nucleosyl)-tetraphosphatase (symmetrical) [Bordetella genomosp. 1]